MENRSEVVGFLSKVTLAHVATYFIVGVVAATVLDYESVFAEPVVRDYMKAFGSVALFVGPVVQVARGLLIAAVLLPFRSTLETRYGWFWLWLLLVGIGIFSTAAAAPSSIEGIVYTRLPVWYHLIGLPEMLTQTLLFSLICGLAARHPRGILVALPPVFKRVARALVSASLAFAAYAIVSVLFALTSGARIDAEQSLTLRVQGIFVMPFLINAMIAFATAQGAFPRRRLAGALASYSGGVVVIMLYQIVVAGDFNVLYALVAPALPALVLWLVTPPPQRTHSPGALTSPDARRRRPDQ